MQFTLLLSLGAVESGVFCYVHNDNYLKQAILLCFSPAETDQSTQEPFTTKMPRATELAKTTQGNAISPPLDTNFSFFIFNWEIKFFYRMSFLITVSYLIFFYLIGE